jgi:hypothetical protein
VRRRDRVADVPDQGDVVLPDADAAEQQRRGNARQDEDRAAEQDRPQAAGEQGPDEHQAGLELHDRAERACGPDRQRTVDPSPADREQEEQQRPDLAELERVRDRPGQTGEQERRPSDGRPNREQRGPGDEHRHRPADPEPGRGGRRDQGEGEDGEHEGRRVVEQAEAAGLLDRRVVEALAGEDAARRLVVRRGSRTRACRRPGPRESRARG